MTSTIRVVGAMVRSPIGHRGVLDHEPNGDGRTLCGLTVNPDTWVVISQQQSVNRCGNCTRVTL